MSSAIHVETREGRVWVTVDCGDDRPPLFFMLPEEAAEHAGNELLEAAAKLRGEWPHK